LNKFIASGTALSRRKADEAIAAGRVTVNGKPAEQGMDISENDVVTLDNQTIRQSDYPTTTIMLNKPPGYVVSRDGQGSQTIYDLLPPEYQHLNPVGRLDKYSSGLLLLTNDGQLAHELTHPSRQKTKIYEVYLDKPLEPLHQQMISDYGIMLEDGLSKFSLQKLETSNQEIEEKQLVPSSYFLVSMHEGRNRQIRRTFESLGYRVTHLHRTHFGEYQLGTLKPGTTKRL